MTQTCSTLIDLLLTTKEEKIAESGVIHASISDHSIAYAIRKGKRLRVPPGKYKQGHSKHLFQSKLKKIFTTQAEIQDIRLMMSMAPQKPLQK